MKILFPLFQVSQTSTILVQPKNGRLYVFFSTTRQIIIGRFEHGRFTENRSTVIFYSSKETETRFINTKNTMVPRGSRYVQGLVGYV